MSYLLVIYWVVLYCVFRSSMILSYHLLINKNLCNNFVLVKKFSNSKFDCITKFFDLIELESYFMTKMIVIMTYYGRTNNENSLVGNPNPVSILVQTNKLVFKNYLSTNQNHNHKNVKPSYRLHIRTMNTPASTLSNFMC